MNKNFTDLQIYCGVVDGLKFYEPDCYHDFRGYYWTNYNFKDDKLIFNHDKISVSKKNVLRGIHGDSVTTKMVTCAYGEVYCVVVDNRKDSQTYKQWYWTMLNHNNRRVICLPPGVGLGYLITSDEASILYKWSYVGDYPDIDKQFTLRWDDKDLNIYWPTDNPILQPRDRYELSL